DYSRALKEKGIPHAIFSGKQTNRNRKAMVEDYNKGKLKALLVSSAGGEGLDLKGTRQVQVLEPHWNTEKLKQVEGRAIRRGSHTHLPKKDQNVVLQRFEAYPLGGIIGKRRGVEQVLADMAANKEKLNQELLSLLPGDRGVKKKASLNKLSQQEKAMSLVDVLNQLETADEEMEKEAQEHEKIAAEEEAAGRITARGFMDELNKLAQAMQFKPEKVGPSAAALPKKNIGGALPPPVKPGSVVQPGKGAGMAATQKKQQRLYR
nr:hypothetical protein [Desulfobacterales bacterium]